MGLGLGLIRILRPEFAFEPDKGPENWVVGLEPMSPSVIGLSLGFDRTWWAHRKNMNPRNLICVVWIGPGPK